jgi:anti-sigma factor RsiW
MKSCDNIRDSLGPWLDGELGQREADAVRAHVEACLECSEERRQLDKLNSSMQTVLASQGRPIAFGPFWLGVQQRINERRPWHVEWVERVRASLGGPALAWGIPVVIALMIGLYSLGVWKDETQRNNFAAVESIDAHGRNVALLRENETKTTVIWLYQNQEGDNESAGETSDKSPTF